jgi:hypothetical protein
MSDDAEIDVDLLIELRSKGVAITPQVLESHTKAISPSTKAYANDDLRISHKKSPKTEQAVVPPPAHTCALKACEFSQSRKRQNWLKSQRHFRHVKLLQILCAAFIVIYTYGGFEGASKRDESGMITDPDPGKFLLYLNNV